MPICEIPIQQSNGNCRVQFSLPGNAGGDVPYLFDFKWNARDTAWYLDIYDVNEVPIWRGIKVVIGTYLGRACQDPLFTSGVLIATDTSGKTIDAGFDDFGTRVKLAYLPTADLLVAFNKSGVK